MILLWLKKIVIALVAFGICFYGGYLYGIQHQKLEDQKGVTTQVTKVLEKQEAGQSVANKHEASAVVGVTQIKDHYITVQKDVIRYVTKNPNSNDVLDSEWVRNFNSSANGIITGDSTTSFANPAVTTQDASEPTATKGEALEAIAEHDKNYYICKKGLDEMVGFYQDLRVKLNSSESK